MRLPSFLAVLGLGALANAARIRRDGANLTPQIPGAVSLTSSPSTQPHTLIVISQDDTKLAAIRRSVHHLAPRHEDDEDEDDEDDDDDDEDDDDDDNDRPNTGAIAGGTVGGLLFLVLLILGTWYWQRVRRRRSPRRPSRSRFRFPFRRLRRQKDEEHEAGSTYHNPPPHIGPGGLPHMSQSVSPPATAADPFRSPGGQQTAPVEMPTSFDRSESPVPSPSPLTEEHHTPTRPAPGMRKE
ncbi:hypothetical protein F4775DRAFT_596184 [Biscogniauxia sp. FL1348]|nr:hypothetical protein F4775DRAFT_596184 [Biscogniauxia sp. FL1348]